MPDEWPHPLGDGVLELVDAPGVGLDGGDEFAAVQHAESVKGALGDLGPDPELVEMPARSVLVHQVRSVVEEQADLPRPAGEEREGEAVRSEGRPGRRQGVDGVGLAPVSPSAAGRAPEHERDPQHRLAGTPEVGFQASGPVPAVLDGPGPSVEPVGAVKGPQVAGRSGQHPQVSDGPPLHGQGDQGVGAFVRVDAENNGGTVPLK